MGQRNGGTRQVYVEEEFENDDSVNNEDTIEANLDNGICVLVTGEQVKDFMDAYQNKVRYYLSSPFFNVFSLSKKNTAKIKSCVAGAGICKYYGFDSRRFVESQFYFFHAWKNTYPILRYVVDLKSSWNSVQRYGKYVSNFESQIAPDENSDDNISPTYQMNKSSSEVKEIPDRLKKIYDEIIVTQMRVTGKSKKAVLEIFAESKTIYLPKQYLETIPEYQELIQKK